MKANLIKFFVDKVFLSVIFFYFPHFSILSVIKFISMKYLKCYLNVLNFRIYLARKNDMKVL